MTGVAAVVSLVRPGCAELMLEEVARGVSAGLLFTTVKVLVIISRPHMVRRPMTTWCRYGWTAARRELKFGLIGGFLLGLLLAMRACLMQ